MMKLLKNRIFILILSLFIIVILLIFLGNNKQNNRILKENSYTIYVSTHSLVKLTFKESYYECTKANGVKDICSDVNNEVTSYELLNDSAKRIYKNIDFKKNSVIEALIKFSDELKDNNINFEEINIVTNYRFNDEILESAVKKDSKYHQMYNIIIDYQKNLNEQEIINKLTKDSK